jgi:hypothetical protein
MVSENKRGRLSFQVEYNTCLERSEKMRKEEAFGTRAAARSAPLRIRHRLAHLPLKTVAGSRPRLRPMVVVETRGVACRVALRRSLLPGT